MNYMSTLEHCYCFFYLFCLVCGVYFHILKHLLFEQRCVSLFS
uniref:Uncharacterized protein n=1 Tax=Anguilla anguilla TaxID=7936 RepID=A0A0E9QJX9_ANGAN